MLQVQSRRLHTIIQCLPHRACLLLIQQLAELVQVYLSLRDSHNMMLCQQQHQLQYTTHPHLGAGGLQHGSHTDNTITREHQRGGTQPTSVNKEPNNNPNFGADLLRADENFHLARGGITIQGKQEGASCVLLSSNLCHINNIIKDFQQVFSRCIKCCYFFTVNACRNSIIMVNFNDFIQYMFFFYGDWLHRLV